MLPITDDTIEGLEPSDKRYDVEVEGDLVLSVLPNGSKTWVLVSGRGADARRRSLGVYPDMSVLEACSSARNFWETDNPRDARQADTRYVLRDGQVVAAGAGSKALTLGVAAGLLVLLASGWLIVDTYRRSPGEPPPVAPDTRPAAALAATGSALVRPSPGEASTGSPDIGAPQPRPPAIATVDPVVAATDVAETPAADSDPVPSDDSVAEAPPAMAAAGKPGPGEADLPTEPAAHSVARAQLTTEVRNREPVDDLGNSVTASGAELSRVYFFTELRSLEGKTVTHVWERDGEVKAQVPFDVGGWRWRVFSSKDILASEEGRWQVTVVDDDGRVLAEQPFEFVAGLPPE